jgi:hypothetical protein
MMSEITDSMFHPAPKPPTKSESYQQQAAEDILADKPPRRKLPWLIDIFLYPVSKPGLMMLAVFIGIPLFIELLRIFTSMLVLGFPPLVVLLYCFIVFGAFVKIVVLLYIYWYLCECIHSSADGYIRAPDVISTGPSIGDMFWQLIKILSCLALFATPATLYYQYTQKTDTIFAALIYFAAFIFPMALLSVVMFDSFTGLNPVVVIGSIFSTFFYYCVLVASLVVLGHVAVKAFYMIRQTRIMSWVMLTGHIYFMMVAAHLLGRFYYKYQEKLNWDV